MPGYTKIYQGFYSDTVGSTSTLVGIGKDRLGCTRLYTKVVLESKGAILDLLFTSSTVQPASEKARTTNNMDMFIYVLCTHTIIHIILGFWCAS